LTRHGNRVGALFFSGGLDTMIPARVGRAHVLHILNTLLARPELSGAPATDLTAFLQMAGQMIKRRSLVFLVSDFISTPGWDKPFSHLPHHQQPLALPLFRPLQKELPVLGLVVMQDAEPGEQVFVDTDDGRFRKRLPGGAHRRETELRASFGRASVDAL